MKKKILFILLTSLFIFILYIIINFKELSSGIDDGGCDLAENVLVITNSKTGDYDCVSKEKAKKMGLDVD